MPDYDDLNSAIDAYSENAYGSDTDGGELSRQRSLALDAFAGKNFEPAPKDRSQVTDMAVFETCQWLMPSLMRIYAGGDDVVEFDPEGPEDEDAATQESEVLNYLVTERNNFDLVARTWMQDALLTKNAYCMAFMEERKTPEIEKYEGQTPEQLSMLLEDDPEIVSSDERIDEDQEPQPVIDPQTGQPAIDPMTGQPILQPVVVYDVELRRVKTKKRLQLQVLAPERCKIGEDTPDFTLDECNYFEYWEDTTLSDLRKDGFEVDDDIEDTYGEDTMEDWSRDEIFQTDRNRGDLTPDPSMRQVIVRTIWIRYDYDGDGIAELQKVVRVGHTVLEREETSSIPVACIVPFINTHRHLGMSVADLVFDVQRIKTVLLRAMLDSLYLSVNPRHAASNKVNLDDLLVSRPGGVVQVDTDMPDIQGHVMALPTEFVAPQAQEGMRHMDTVIESRVGVNKMFQGIDTSAMTGDNAYNSIGQLSTMAAQRVEDIARLFSVGYTRLFKVAHELIIKSGHQGEAIKLRGQWTNVDPTQWRTGRDMRVVAPFAAGNKDSLLQRLMIIGQIQEKMLAGGLPTVDMQDVYNLATEISSAADVPGDRFFTDPSTVEPQPPPPDYTAMALEIENKKADNQAADSQVDAEIDKYKADLDAQISKYRADLEAEVKITLERMKAGEQVNLETVKAELESMKPRAETGKVESLVKESAKKTDRALEATIKELQKAVETMSAEKEIIRDKDGKVTGARAKK